MWLDRKALPFVRRGWRPLVVALGLGLAASAVAATRAPEPGDIPDSPPRQKDEPPPAAPAGEGGRPVCVRVGTRSEGWAWPSGHFIHWAKCKGVTPRCDPHGKEGAGWYARGALIANDACPAKEK